MSIFWYRFRHVLIGGLVLACLPLLTLLPPVNSTQNSLHGDSSRAKVTSTYDSPNAISNGMAVGATILKQTANSIVDGIDDAAYKVSLTLYNGIRQIGKSSLSSYKAIAVGIGSATAFVAHTTIEGILFISQGVGNIFALITKVPAVNAYIRPATSTPVATIEPLVTAATAVQELPAIPAHSDDAQHVDSETLWPIHGKITTLFGVPHFPFQPIHTGIDISSGRRAGVTAVTPFKPGKVIDVVHSNRGLGNHVVVDHGEGLTSVYAHLNSTEVKVGQVVGSGTILGHEGSTGTSTGTHLHFEIRLHGKPVNPQRYIDDSLG